MEPKASADEANEIILSSYLNAAMCHMKLEQYIEAIEKCKKVLTKDPNNVKALFRRKSAYAARTQDFDEAKADLIKAASLAPIEIQV